LRNRKQVSFMSLTMIGLWSNAGLFFLYLFSHNFIILGIITGISACTAAVYNIAQFSYRLGIIPDHLQGRVNSVFRFVVLGLRPLGAFLGGVFLERPGTPPTILFFGVCLTLLALMATANSAVRNAREI